MTRIRKTLEEKAQHNLPETKLNAIDLDSDDSTIPDEIDLGQLRMKHWRNKPDAHFMDHEGFLHAILDHIGKIRGGRVWDAAQKGHANPANPTAAEQSSIHSIGDTVVGNLVTCPVCKHNLPSCDVRVCATCPELLSCHPCQKRQLERFGKRCPASGPHCLTCLMGPRSMGGTGIVGAL